MFTRVKNVLYNVVGGLEALPAIKDGEVYSDRLPLKFRYTRPDFLQLTTDDEVQVSADHVIRPIIVPRDVTKLPWNSGYAEAINAGKSIRNEDQGALYRGVLYQSFNETDVQMTKTPYGAGQTLLSNISAIATHLPGNSAESQTNRDLKGEPTPNDTGAVPEDSGYTTPPSTPEHHRKQMVDHTLPWVYFALFDGHAGSGVAVAAANSLHKLIQENLQSVVHMLLPPPGKDEGGSGESVLTVQSKFSFHEKHVTADSLVTGALESAFWEMDRRIAQDKKQYTMTGGCTVLVAVFILGKLYIANAGDSRAVMCRGNKACPMSTDFTPETERERIRKLGLLRPELLGGEFTQIEYIRRPVRKDVGKKMLYRDAYMSGWAYKTITLDDLKFPLIYGEGKRSRVLATIGVTRGFGDHDLKALNTEIDIKPFLTAQPEVTVFDLNAEELTDSDVLVMGTDGLWDVTLIDKAAEVVQKSLDHFPANDIQRYKYRYTSAAQDLVMHSRGKLRERNWRTADNKLATIDDISVFVIPLRPYKEEYLHWKANRDACILNAKIK